MNDTVLKIIREVEPILDKLECEPENLSEILGKFRENEAVDYDILGPAFSKLYWQRNFWKAFYFFEYEYTIDHLREHKFINVLVPGAGSGADTIAFLAYVNKNLPGLKIRLEFIDQSHVQLKIAKKLINSIRPYLKNISFDITYTANHFEESNLGGRVYDLIIMSHFLTENSIIAQHFINITHHNLSNNGDLIVIERLKDPVWKKSIEAIANKGVTVYSSKLKSEYINKMASRYCKVKTDMSPFYVRASFPNRSYQAELVENYFVAWREQSLPIIESIFTKDANYDEKPGIEEMIEGIDGVLDYWKKNPMLQKDIDVSIKNVGFGPSNAVCAFEGDFDTPKQHISIKGAIDFGIDNYSRRICSVREYFGTVKTPFF